MGSAIRRWWGLHRTASVHRSLLLSGEDRSTLQASVRVSIPWGDPVREGGGRSSHPTRAEAEATGSGSAKRPAPTEPPC